MTNTIYSKVGETDAPVWRRCRIWMAVLAFFGFIFLYSQRVGMSVAILCMVNQTAVRQLREVELYSELDGNITFHNEKTYTLNGNNHNLSSADQAIIESEVEQCGQISDKDNSDGPFVWTKTVQGNILGSFFYGYLLSQVPSGLLAERYSGKWVFTVMYAISTIGTLLTPMAARVHYGVLIATRALVGLGSGGIFPATHCMLGQWAPPLERSLLTGIAYAGFSLGNVISLPVSGLLCGSNFFDGWDSIFYLFGILSAIWLLLWIFLVGNSPSSCKIISKEEKQYIRDSLDGQLSKTTEKKRRTPWLSILKSPAVWAIITANVTSDWGIYTMLTNIPTYMYEVLHFDMTTNGLYSALPFLGMWIMMLISPPLADKLQSSKLLSTANSRKLFNSIAEFGACVFLIALGFISCNQTALAVALLTLGATVHGACYSAWLVNPMDIAPQYAGTIFGISNMLGAMTGFIAPPVAAALTPNQTREEWQMVFFLAAGIYAVGGVIFIICARGELQPWAVDSSNVEDMQTDVNETLKLSDTTNEKEKSSYVDLNKSLDV